MESYWKLRSAPIGRVPLKSSVISKLSPGSQSATAAKWALVKILPPEVMSKQMLCPPFVNPQ